MADKKRSRAMSLSLDWDAMIREEQESDKATKALMAGTIAYDRDTVDFCTGSSYTGKWNSLGMNIYGNYLYAHGCEYEGGFEDGMFHGEGIIQYPMGQRLECVWDKGEMVSYKFCNADGLDYETNWKYCKMPDRRFTSSLREGLQPAGKEFMTNQLPEKIIPPGCYDTGDGIYNPRTKCIIADRDSPDVEGSLSEQESEYSIEKLEKSNDEIWVQALTMVSEKREQWIMKNCRKAWDEPAGYRPEFYEDWVSGRQSELNKLDSKYEKTKSPYGSLFDEQERRIGESYDFDKEVQVPIGYAHKEKHMDEYIS